MQVCKLGSRADEFSSVLWKNRHQALRLHGIGVALVNEEEEEEEE